MRLLKLVELKVEKLSNKQHTRVTVFSDGWYCCRLRSVYAKPRERRWHVKLSPSCEDRNGVDGVLNPRAAHGDVKHHGYKIWGLRWGLKGVFLPHLIGAWVASTVWFR